MEVMLDQQVLSKFPDTKIAILRYSTRVDESSEAFWSYLKKEVLPVVEKSFKTAAVSELKNIASSRRAYKSFGIDPSRHRISSESLLRRIKQKKELYHINTVVDTNNLISIISGFSVGSYDTKRIGEKVVVRLGRENEFYEGIGSDKFHLRNLPVLADENGAFGSATRDSNRAIIQLQTTDIMTVIYGFTEEDIAQVLHNAEEYIKKFAFAKEIKTVILDATNTKVTL